MAIKNFWSLAVDEAIVSDKLKTELGKNYEVFFPVNSQLKDIDLIIYNLKTQKSKSVQVKGSRTYDPRKSEVERFGNGKASWNVVKKESIFTPKNEVDFYIFIIHIDEVTKTSRKIVQKYLVIPIKEFRKTLKDNKKHVGKNGKYHFFFWFNSKNNSVIEISNSKNKTIDFSKFLNNFDLLKNDS